MEVKTQSSNSSSSSSFVLPKGPLTPLKLPPRFQYNSDFKSLSEKHRSLSPNATVCEIPFARKNTWNDGFDPFATALQKVREEKRGTIGPSSYSPFKFISKCSSSSGCININQEYRSPIKKTQVQKRPSCYEPPLLKGSSYARWVRSQTKEGGLGRKGTIIRLRGSLSRQSTRLLKIKHGKFVAETKVQKIKAILQRYASFGREDNEYNQSKITSSVDQKLSYFSRLSFKFKWEKTTP